MDGVEDLAGPDAVTGLQDLKIREFVPQIGR